MALRARLVGFMIYPCPSCCFDTIALIPDALVRSHLGCYRVLGMLCFSMIREASLSCNVVFCLCIISEACLVILICWRDGNQFLVLVQGGWLLVCW